MTVLFSAADTNMWSLSLSFSLGRTLVQNYWPIGLPLGKVLEKDSWFHSSSYLSLSHLWRWSVLTICVQIPGSNPAAAFLSLPLICHWPSNGAFYRCYHTVELLEWEPFFILTHQCNFSLQHFIIPRKAIMFMQNDSNFTIIFKKWLLVFFFPPNIYHSYVLIIGSIKD